MPLDLDHDHRSVVALVAEFNTDSSWAYSRAVRGLISNTSVKKQQSAARTGSNQIRKFSVKKIEIFLNTEYTCKIFLAQLGQCIELFLQEEELDEEDAWYCPTCKQHQQATKKFDLWSLPSILIVQLKRFGTQRYAFSSRRKVKNQIDFPLDNLNLSEYITGPQDLKTPPNYTLIGVSNHMGEMGFGHYTAYCRAVRNNEWYHFDDSSVSKVSADQICSRSAYVLVYCREDVWRSWRDKASID